MTESRERERRTVEKESDRVTGEREEKKRNEQKRKQGRGRNGENEEGNGKWPTVKRVRVCKAERKQERRKGKMEILWKNGRGSWFFI